MRKLTKILLVALLAVVAAAGLFVWKIFRGAQPAIAPSPEDIAELLSSNTTEMPLKMPSGFSISIFAKELGNPRVMQFGPDGNLWVSVPSRGQIVSLRDGNADGFAEEMKIVADNLNQPHGFTFRCLPVREAGVSECKIYVAETDQVAVYDFDADAGKLVNKKKIVDLPSGGGHSTRTLLFMPYPDDSKLLISVGSSCNVCNESDWRRAKILVYDVEKGGEPKVFASGLRNAVFMTIHPVNGKIWATEMGRDWLGDNLPPDEINILEEGKNYGWPVCYGKNIHDTDFDKNTYIRNPCMEPFEVPSYIDIPAHSAPLGFAFFPEEGWPQEYWHNLLVAYHGSWNRSEPTGYKIVRYRLDENGDPLAGGFKEEDFITGWLAGNEAIGRPVDILIQPGGTIFVSDDKAGVIYRILYRPPRTSSGDKSDLIRVLNLQPDDLLQSPAILEGVARGYWFFEASFPIKLFDAGGKEIAVAIAQAHPPAGGDWMTENFVPFRAELSFSAPKTETGWLVFEKDNPSGLPEYADELRFPVRFRYTIP